MREASETLRGFQVNVSQKANSWSDNKMAMNKVAEKSPLFALALLQVNIHKMHETPRL